MSGNRKPSANDSAVRERRLRPIYELLDSSNNKRVVQEVDRLLKKQPDATCAKVLKALALLRMGKVADCEAILNPVMEEVHTDDNIIQALSICYRELDQPQMICQLLEKTCQVDKSEDIMTNCFMAYARVADYQKQHQMALALYKLYAKTPYFSWAIMSLYAKAEIVPDPLVTKVSLPLAERMMAKFIEDSKKDSSDLTDHELTLYALILRKQKKYDKMLDLLDTPFGKLKLSDSIGFYNKYKTECLVELQRFDELADFMEANLRKNPDDYNSYAEYIKNFGETQTERVIEFLKEMRDQEKCGRSPLLAYLYLFQFLFDRKLEPKVAMDPISIFTKYAELYGDKPSFFMDLCGFLSGLKLPDAKDAFLSIMKDFIKTPIEYLNPKEMQRHINYRYMSRFFSNRKQLDGVKIMECLTESIDVYLTGYENYEEAKRTGKPFEEMALVEFLLIPCLALVDSFWFDSLPWKDSLKRLSEANSQNVHEESQNRRVLPSFFSASLHKSKPDEDLNHDETSSKLTTVTQNGTDEESEEIDADAKLNSIIDTSINSLSKNMENLNITEKDYVLLEEDFPILLNLALLEHAATRSPKSAQLRILLSKSYIKCGAVGAGADAIIALDLKHMQWESLGYLYIWKLTSFGFFQEATTIFKLAGNLYSSYQRESMEFVLSAYKYGSWEKILEFMDFRELLLNSVQNALLKVERQLLEYSKTMSLRLDANQSNYNASKYNNPTEVAQRSELSLTSLKLNEKYTESRDFGVLLTYSEEKVSKEAKNLTREADITKLKVRGLLALILDQLLLTSLDEGSMTRLGDVETLLTEFDKVVQEDFSRFQVGEIPVDGMWPPRLHEYQLNGHLELLRKLFKLTTDTLKKSKLEALPSCVSDIVNQTTKMVNEIVNLWKSSSHNLLNRAVKLESLYELIETFGFCIIVLDVCMTHLRKASVNQAKKKKKGKDVLSAAIEASHQEYNRLLDNFLQCLKTIEATLDDHPLCPPECFPVDWEKVSAVWGKYVSADLKTYILPYSLPAVMRKLRLSYDRSFSDLKASISCKKTHLEGLRLLS